MKKLLLIALLIVGCSGSVAYRKGKATFKDLRIKLPIKVPVKKKFASPEREKWCLKDCRRYTISTSEWCKCMTDCTLDSIYCRSDIKDKKKKENETTLPYD